jgi:hypothetical protein
MFKKIRSRMIANSGIQIQNDSLGNLRVRLQEQIHQ